MEYDRNKNIDIEPNQLIINFKVDHQIRLRHYPAL